jgi:hypothetical protein
VQPLLKGLCSIAMRIECKSPLGFPDVLIAIDGRIVLLELKVVRSGAKVALSPHQIAFAHQASEAGLGYALLVHYWPESVLRAVDTDVYGYRANRVIEVAKRGISEKPNAAWRVGDAEGLQSFLKSV